MQSDLGAFADQAQGDGATDAFGGAGDQDDFSKEVRQRMLLSLWYVQSAPKNRSPRTIAMSNWLDGRNIRVSSNILLPLRHGDYPNPF